MPPRDHFRPPRPDRRSWEGLLGGWSMTIVSALGRELPGCDIAGMTVHLGPSVEIDVAAFEDPGSGSGMQPAWESGSSENQGKMRQGVAS